MRRIVYVSWPAQEIAGGIKMAFRHVETLMAAGFSACVATPDGAQPGWFDTTIKVLPLSALVPGSDVLVFPENHAGFLHAFASWPNLKVVFCQNQFMIWRGIAGYQDYADFGVTHIICPSHESAAVCRRRSGAPKIHIVPIPLDRQTYSPRTKRLQVAFSPRKRALEAACVQDLFWAENRDFRSIPWVKIEGMSEAEVARVLGESALYLALGRFEAFGMSALEALSAGCVVAGFTGFGGREFTTSKNGFWAIEDDCIDCTDKLTQAARLVIEGGDRLQRLLDGAANTTEYYSFDRFVTQLVGCWRTILGVSSPA